MSVLFKHEYAHNSYGGLVKMEILIQQAWDAAQDRVFLTSSQLMPTLLMHEPLFKTQPPSEYKVLSASFPFPLFNFLWLIIHHLQSGYGGNGRSRGGNLSPVPSNSLSYLTLPLCPHYHNVDLGSHFPLQQASSLVPLLQYPSLQCALNAPTTMILLFIF